MVVSAERARMQKPKLPFDYSKWDKIDLSDDEDDFHPNIDNASFIRYARARADRASSPRAAPRWLRARSEPRPECGASPARAGPSAETASALTPSRGGHDAGRDAARAG